MSGKVCMVSGVGEGNGHAISQRFAREGYRVAMLARSQERLERFEREIPGASGFVCDVTDVESMRAACAAVRDRLGPVDILVHNAGSGMFADFLSTSTEDMEAAWRTNTLGLFVLGREVVGDMLERGAGNIIVIGATSALRGGADFTPFAQGKAAQRSLAQSMARGLGPRGVHVSYVVVDGVIDIPAVRAMDWARDLPDDFFLRAEHIADAVWYLRTQPKSAWTFELDLRPFGEKW